jgi:hypothetical protein
MSLKSGKDAVGAGPGAGFFDRSTAAVAAQARAAVSMALIETAASRGDVVRMGVEMLSIF